MAKWKLPVVKPSDLKLKPVPRATDETKATQSSTAIDAEKVLPDFSESPVSVVDNVGCRMDCCDLDGSASRPSNGTDYTQCSDGRDDREELE